MQGAKQLHFTLLEAPEQIRYDSPTMEEISDDVLGI